MSTTAQIKTRFGGFFFAARSWMRAFCHEQFWGGHPNTFRAIFAWASLSLGVFMLIEAPSFEKHGYEFMRSLAPVQLWALAFIAHWACVSLVVLCQRTSYGVGIGVQLLVNVYGFSIWSMYVVLQDMSLGHLAINASAERVLVLYSVWAILRTGMNRRTDRTPS